MENNTINQPTQAVVSKNTKQEVALAISEKNISDSILANFNKLATQGQLVIPKDYAIGNQLKLMYATIAQSGHLGKVTEESIGLALTEAVLQGLEVDKDQVYFIPRGTKLTMFRSYHGEAAVAKRTKLAKDVRARVIYQGDEFEMGENEEGEEIVATHKTNLSNRDNEILGAYAWVVAPDGHKTYCIMSKKEIDTAWSKSTDPSRKSQKDFPQEMAKRTVIRRLVKTIYKTTPSEYLSEEARSIIGSYNRTTPEEYVNEPNKCEGIKHAVTDENGEIIENVPVNE